MKNLNVIFMGTPLFSTNVLKELIKNTNVMMVVCQPDKRVGRKGEIEFSPVKKLALENNIEVFQPVKIRNDYQKVLDLKPDIIITCAYGQIIPKCILDCPKYGCINVHASLLPKYRGGAPIHWAIINGEKVTGITIMYMDEHMDSGDIISQESIKINEDDTTGSVSEKLSFLGSKLLMNTLPSIIDKTNNRIKQDESQVTFAYTIKREDELIDFNLSNEEVYNFIRGLYPVPLAYFTINDMDYKVIKAEIIEDNSDQEPGTIIDVNSKGILIQCKIGMINITRVKVSGKKEMDVKDYINGIAKNELIGVNVNGRKSIK